MQFHFVALRKSNAPLAVVTLMQVREADAGNSMHLLVDKNKAKKAASKSKQKMQRYKASRNWPSILDHPVQKDCLR